MENKRRVYQPFATYICGNREADCVCRGIIQHEVAVPLFLFFSQFVEELCHKLAERRGRNLMFLGKTGPHDSARNHSTQDSDIASRKDT